LLRNSRCGLSRFARADQSARAGEAEISSGNNESAPRSVSS